MHSVGKDIWRVIGVVAGALVLPHLVNGADAAASTRSSTLLFMSYRTYAITAVVMVLLISTALALFLKRRSGRATVSTRPSVQAGAPQQEDSHGVQRARKADLASTSGMLGELLDQYLRSRFCHLLLIYPDTPSLQKRLSEVEGEYGAVSFFYFCKLISLLTEYESEGAALPPLSNQVAHDAAQRLINTFLSSIPQGGEEGSVDAFEVATKFTEHRLKLRKVEAQSGIPSSQIGDFVRRVDPKRYVSEGQLGGKLKEFLPKEFAAYENWLTLASPGLIVAAEALRALCRLISEDLYGVSYHFWRDSSFRPFGTEDSSALSELSDKLTPLGLEMILSESRLPRPIGVFLRRGPAPPEPQELQPTKQQPESAPERATPQGSSSGGVTQIFQVSARQVSIGR